MLNDDVTSGFRHKSKLGVRIRLNFCLKKSGLAALIKKSAMEFRKSIINNNGLTKIDDHLAYSVKKKFNREIKNGSCLKTVNFKNFSIYKSGPAALIKKTTIQFRKIIINYNELTRGYAHLVYPVNKLENLIVKSKMAAV